MSWRPGWRGRTGIWVLATGAALILLGLASGSILAFRWANGGSSPGQAYSCQSSDTIGAIPSLRSAAYQEVVIVQIDGQPVERKDVFGDVTIVREDYSVTVEQYLTKSGEPKIIITEPRQDITTFPNGETCASARHTFAKLEADHRYVLFGTKTTTGLWSFVGVPFGFEIMTNGKLRAIDQDGYTVQPATWGLSTLSDMKQQLAAIVASFPTQTAAP